MRIIAGRWRGHRIQAPAGKNTRPTTDRVREAWMSILGEALLNARVLDLFAGSGALGLEALSRGARSAVFVEKSAASVRSLEANVRKLGAGSSAQVIRGDALRHARGLKADAFDVALADPPYGRGMAAGLVARFAEVPFAALLAVEHRTDEPLPALAASDTRRYGDTALSFFHAPP